MYVKQRWPGYRQQTAAQHAPALPPLILSDVSGGDRLRQAMQRSGSRQESWRGGGKDGGTQAVYQGRGGPGTAGIFICLLKQRAVITQIPGKGYKIPEVQALEPMEDETLGVCMPCRM